MRATTEEIIDLYHKGFMPREIAGILRNRATPRYVSVAHIRNVIHYFG